jgi:8-oxo-dGTP pyrophosphatase MutT (NUDIX family)
VVYQKRQAAALCWRRSSRNAAEVLLITSRNGRRWIFPKGWPKDAESLHLTAKREAFEEAGVVGKIGMKPIGIYSYGKKAKTRTTVPVLVQVFPLEVLLQQNDWPEKNQRKTVWMPLGPASERVSMPQLRPILNRLSSLPKVRLLLRTKLSPRR